MILKKCRVCDSTKLVTVIDLKKQPLANNLAKKNNQKVKRYPLKVLFCKNCSNSQLSIVINNKKFEFKTKIKKIHLNRAQITHGGYLCSIIDAGSGSAAHFCAKGKLCVTISLEIKFISSTKINDEILGSVRINKKTRTLVFLDCILKSKNKVVASASGIWKILNDKI